MSTNPIRYAVVGLGRAGWNIHVAGLRGRADAKIVAVVDPVEARRDEAKKEFGCETYTSLTEMLKQKDVEVAVIATPSVMHGPDVKQALKAGKHVVVEKPMAMSVAEADSMIAASKAAKKMLMVHQNYRFFRDFTLLKDIVDSGIIGKVFHIRYHTAGFSRRNDWQTLVKNGGGVLNNTCPHVIDQFLQIVGSPVVQCMGDLRQIASSGDVEDHVKAFLRTKSGCTIDMEVSSSENITAPAGIPQWVICGSYGTLTRLGKDVTVRYFDPKEVKPLPVVEGPAAERRYGNEDKLPWQEKVIPADQGPDKGNFYDAVYRTVREKAKPYITPESVREVIRTIELIRKGTAFTGKPKAAKSKKKSK